MDREIVIGKIVAPHGVRGDIRILPLTDKPEQFLDLEYLLLPNGKQLTVKHARFHKNMVLVKAEEVSNMNEAELLRNMDVSVYFEDLPALEEGEYYVADMVGMDVVDETGKKIGTFKDAASLAACRIVPSPPSTITQSTSPKSPRRSSSSSPFLIALSQLQFFSLR